MVFSFLIILSTFKAVDLSCLIDLMWGICNDRRRCLAVNKNIFITNKRLVCWYSQPGGERRTESTAYIAREDRFITCLSHMGAFSEAGTAGAGNGS